MDRRRFLLTSLAGMLAAPRAAKGQSVRLPLVAILEPGLAAAPSYGTGYSRRRSRRSTPMLGLIDDPALYDQRHAALVEKAAMAVADFAALRTKMLVGLAWARGVAPEPTENLAQRLVEHELTKPTGEAACGLGAHRRWRCLDRAMSDSGLALPGPEGLARAVHQLKRASAGAEASWRPSIAHVLSRLRLEDIASDEHRRRLTFVLLPVRRVLPRRDRLAFVVFLGTATITVFDEPSLDEVCDGGPIFVRMYTDHTARLELEHT
jgi:hypothetical protein